MIDPYASEVHARYRQEQLLREAEQDRVLRIAQAGRAKRAVSVRVSSQARGWAIVRWVLTALGGRLVAAGTWLQQVACPPLTHPPAIR